MYTTCMYNVRVRVLHIQVHVHIVYTVFAVPVQVYQLMYDLADHSEPITGLHLEPFPDQALSSEVKYFVLATTPKRIYQFIGTVTKGEAPQFVPLFATYDSVTVQFLEIPGNLKESQLQLWPSKPGTTPRAFAWLTGECWEHNDMRMGGREEGGRRGGRSRWE